MRLNWTALPLLSLALLATSALASNGTKPFSADDLVRLARVSDPQVSPDGKHVVFALRETDIEANRGKVDLWLLNLDDENPVSRRLTQHSASDSSGRWAPDGRGIYFLSSRSGSSQVWHISLAGGEAQQVTSLPLDVGSFEVSPRGDRLALSLEVFPDCIEIKCTTDRLAERKKDKASALSYDALFVRHWDTWNDGTLSRLFTAAIGNDRKAGEFKLVSGGVRGHVPSKPFGGEEDYTFSPDGKRIVFSARIADAKESWSTNFDLYEVAADGTGETRNLTAGNPAWDAQPVFLANGDLAWLAMSRPGFEADRYVVMLRDSQDGKVRALTADWDRSVGHIAASFDGRRLIATADDVGQTALVEIDPKSGYRQRLLGNGQVQGYSPTRDGVVITWASLGSPPDLYLVTKSSTAANSRAVLPSAPKPLTAVNQTLLAERQFGEFEQFSFKGWNDETVYGYVMKPAGFERGKKYPIAFIVHGGPQVSSRTNGPGAGIRRSTRVQAMRSYSSIFMAHRVTAKRSPTRSAKTGAASHSSINKRASMRHSVATTGSMATAPVHSVPLTVDSCRTGSPVIGPIGSSASSITRVSLISARCTTPPRNSGSPSGKTVVLIISRRKSTRSSIRQIM